MSIVIEIENLDFIYEEENKYKDNNNNGEQIGRRASMLVGIQPKKQLDSEDDIHNARHQDTVSDLESNGSSRDDDDDDDDYSDDEEIEEMSLAPQGAEEQEKRAELRRVRRRRPRSKLYNPKQKGKVSSRPPPPLRDQMGLGSTKLTTALTNNKERKTILPSRRAMFKRNMSSPDLHHDVIESFKTTPTTTTNNNKNNNNNNNNSPMDDLKSTSVHSLGEERWMTSSSGGAHSTKTTGRWTDSCSVTVSSGGTSRWSVSTGCETISTAQHDQFLTGPRAPRRQNSNEADIIDLMTKGAGNNNRRRPRMPNRKNVFLRNNLNTTMTAAIDPLLKNNPTKTTDVIQMRRAYYSKQKSESNLLIVSNCRKNGGASKSKNTCLLSSSNHSQLGLLSSSNHTQLTLPRLPERRTSNSSCSISSSTSSCATMAGEDDDDDDDNYNTPAKTRSSWNCFERKSKTMLIEDSSSIDADAEYDGGGKGLKVPQRKTSTYMEDEVLLDVAIESTTTNKKSNRDSQSSSNPSLVPKLPQRKTSSHMKDEVLLDVAIESTTTNKKRDALTFSNHSLVPKLPQRQASTFMDDDYETSHVVPCDDSDDNDNRNRFHVKRTIKSKQESSCLSSSIHSMPRRPERRQSTVTRTSSTADQSISSTSGCSVFSESSTPSETQEDDHDYDDTTTSPPSNVSIPSNVSTTSSSRQEETLAPLPPTGTLVA